MMHRYAGWTVRQPVMVLMTQPRWAAAVSQLALQRHPWGLQLGCQCGIGCPWIHVHFLLLYSTAAMMTR
jgi:hypothetical protein